MNLRLSTVMAAFIIAAAAFGLYVMKYRVQEVKTQTSALADSIATEREAMNLLQAEWAYLNRPERLKALAEKYCRLVPATGEQMVELSAIPARGEPAKAEANPGIGGGVKPASASGMGAAYD